MLRDDYILAQLSKLTKKTWELYIITRILHGLNDLEIEPVCQQYVPRGPGLRAHTDLFFPQFGLHLEIDERHHAGPDHQASDLLRARDIVKATGHEIVRIPIYDASGANRSLEAINEDTDRFIEIVRQRKMAAQGTGRFVAWDYDNAFNPKFHMDRGYIDVADSVRFRSQRDALQCFGYTGGAFQRGIWNLKDGSGRSVWFPRLVPHDEWDNSLSEDGKVITERRSNGQPVVAEHPDIYFEPRTARIVFARRKDILGATHYEFVGVFKLDPKRSSGRVGNFRREQTQVETVNPAKPEAAGPERRGLRVEFSGDTGDPAHP